MSTKRKIHSANFKAKVALDAYKADKTSAELISTHKVTSGQISTWKKQLLDGAVSLFETGHPKALDATASPKAPTFGNRAVVRRNRATKSRVGLA